MDLAAADADARASAAQAESDAHLLVGLRQLVQRHRNYRRALYTCWATIGVAVGCAIVASHDPALHWRGFNLSTAARTVSVVGIWAAFFQWTGTAMRDKPERPTSSTMERVIIMQNKGLVAPGQLADIDEAMRLLR
jgi:hypothetical protein